MTARTLLWPLALAVAVIMLCGSALAQQTAPAKSPFGTPMPSAEKVSSPPQQPASAGIFQRASSWLLAKQAEMHRQLALAVRQFKSSDPFSAALFLAAISFAYGVLHAAGPGHGKAVISSYVLADGQTVRRGVLLSFLAALIQAISALVLVAILVLVLRSTGLQIKAMEGWLETLSWAFVAGVGAWLLYVQLRAAMSPAGAPVHACGHSHHDHHDGHHHHSHDDGGRSSTHGHHHHHHHDHAHAGACEACAHMPAPSQLQGEWSWRRAFALAFAVGIRPCTGAILVLVFAIGQGLWWAGVFSTFAMALGTAITVSALAAMAVGSRELAKRLAGTSGSSKWVGRVQTLAGVGGASLVLILGLVFFVGSLGPAQPF